MAEEEHLNGEQKIRILLIAFVITLAASSLALGQESAAISVSPSDLAALENGGIADGQKIIFEGVVMSRNDESFTVRDARGTETIFVVTNKTVVRTERSIQRETSSTEDDIRCGVRLKVEAGPDSHGQLLAKDITIQSELKTGKAVVHRFKTFANSTQYQTWSIEESRLDQAVWIGASLCTNQPVERCSNYRSACGEDCGAGGCPRRDGCN